MTKYLASCCMEGHQNHCCTSNLFLLNQEAAPTTQEGDMMGPGSDLEESGENCQDRASGFMFRELGREMSVNLKGPRKSTHREFTCLALRR